MGRRGSRGDGGRGDTEDVQGLVRRLGSVRARGPELRGVGGGAAEEEEERGRRVRILARLRLEGGGRINWLEFERDATAGLVRCMSCGAVIDLNTDVEVDSAYSRGKGWRCQACAPRRKSKYRSRKEG